MNSRERFDKVRREKDNRFGLRARLTALVTAEMIVCVILVYGLDLLLKEVIRIPWQIPMELEFLGVCLLIGIVLTSQLSRYFFNPIYKLRKAMEQVADGDFSVRINEKSGTKEIMEIYTGFNLMVHELSNTEILQSDFVSNVSHEFKTPINAIAGYSTLLQDGDNLNAQQKQYVEKILLNAKRLSSLATSTLLLSKLDNQQIPTNRCIYRLDEQIRQSIVGLESAWVNKDIELDAELDRTEYWGNEDMMRHVWDNLISNAVKFSPDGGTVRMTLRQKPDQIVFTIEDDGSGVKEEEQRHIFDRFYQGDNSHTQEGNGLGLALVKRVLDIEGGEIQVKNLSPHGCCFTVILNTKTE